jgi:N-acyl-D-aspartate/D-glutamate deacylase
VLDLLIRNGVVVDGSGAASRNAEVGVKDRRIVEVGCVTQDARETIDASGRIVAPGFIDVHTHYDAQIFWDPMLSPSCYHGVTTALAGFCGFSIAPLSDESPSYLLPMLARVEGMPLTALKEGVPWNWKTFGEYLSRLDGKAGINIGFFAGHSAIRRAVMGPRAVGERADPGELKKMKEMLHQSLGEGALGFSTTASPNHHDGDGNPVPSRWASREEFLELASVVRDHEGTGIEFLPDLAFDEETIELMIDLSLAGQRPVNWNLLGVDGSDEATVSRVNRMLDVSTRARARGARIAALTPPSTSNIQINLFSGYVFDGIPGWDEFFRKGVKERMEVLNDPRGRAELKAMAEKIPAFLQKSLAFPAFRIAEVFSRENKRYQSRLVGQIAKEEGRDPLDVIFDIALADGLKTSFKPEKGGETIDVYKLRSQVWQDDRVLIGASDAGAHMDMLDTFAFSTRLLENGVRKFGVISLEEAIHRITQVPAAFMGLRDRGILAPGYWADITIFDAATVGCGPTYTRFDLPGDEGRLYADASGIDHVFVNGVQIIRHGVHTNNLPGTVLRSGRDTQTVSLPG